MLCAWALLGPAGSRCVNGAEIRLRPHAHPGGTLVVLGDVADIFAADPQQQERLRHIELFPAPPTGQTRFARAKEIQDLLALRGENLLDHVFSGASQVKISRATGYRQADRSTGAVSFLRRRVQRRLSEAIARKLNGNDDTAGWRIEFDLSDQEIEAINRLPVPLWVERRGSAAGPDQMWRVSAGSGQWIDVRARISPAPRVVAAVHAVRRGATIHREDVRLVPAETIDDTVFTSIDEVVGQETTQVLTAGQVLTRDLLRQPTLVNRGQVVTVFSRTAGITVRTTARAQEDGALGDLIPVESLLDRQRFYARVSGIQEVEVYARSSRPVQAAAAREPVRDSARDSAEGFIRSASVNAVGQYGDNTAISSTVKSGSGRSNYFNRAATLDVSASAEIVHDGNPAGVSTNNTSPRASRVATTNRTATRGVTPARLANGTERNETRARRHPLRNRAAAPAETAVAFSAASRVRAHRTLSAEAAAEASRPSLQASVMPSEGTTKPREATARTPQAQPSQWKQWKAARKTVR